MNFYVKGRRFLKTKRQLTSLEGTDGVGSDYQIPCTLQLKQTLSVVSVM